MKTLSTGDGPAEREVRPDGEDLAAGERVGAYRILRLIGRGGMGEVYEADDTRLGRRVALKRIASHRKDDGAARARFWREARGLAAVRHEGLVAVYEIGEDPRVGLFIAMELVDGAPLSALVADGRALPVATALDLVTQAADALGAAHAAGIVHRDIKPGNLLVERGGRVRVVDFGLAKKVDDLDPLTRDGAVLGTPAFMAPEQIEGREVGPPADVFALGLVLYRLLSGVHPFARESAQATALAIAGSLRRPLAEIVSDLDPQLVAVIDKALAVRPEDRYPDGRALCAALGGVGVSAGTPRLEGLMEKGFAVPEALPPSAAASQRERRAARRWLGWLAVAGLLALGAVVLVGGGQNTASEGVSPQLAQASSEVAGSKDKSPRPTPASSGRESGDGAPRAPANTPGGPQAAGGPALALPPRPVVLVLGFDAAESDRVEAEVTAEVLRTRLGEHERRLDSVPLETARVMTATGDVERLPTAPKDWARPRRGRGHVDLLVRGRWSRKDQLTAELEVVETSSGRVLAVVSETVASNEEAPIVLADRLAAALESRLGLEPVSRAELSRVPAAWTALSAARRAGRMSDLGGAREHLAWAVRSDPDFALARVEELAVLRMEGRLGELASLGRELLERPERLTPQALAFTTALVAWAERRSDEALKALAALWEASPYELDPAIQLMALRAKDPDKRDPAEVERIARGILAIAPRQQTAASRLIRALGIEGRAEEAESYLMSIGLQRADLSLGAHWAEVDLYAKRFDDAARGFAAVLEREPGNVYYEHLAITAELLAGRCVEAAGVALDRITRLEALSRESMLDWTYSLATQATICGQRWDGLAGLWSGWSAHSASGRKQSADMAQRVELARAKLDRDEGALARIARRLSGELVGEIPAERELSLAALVLRVGAERATLERLAELAARRSLDRSVSVPDRWAWRIVEKGVAARRALLVGEPREVILKRYDEAIPAMRSLTGEDEARWYVEALVWKAEALEALGEDSRAVWEEVASLGFHRLWVTELWVLAKARSGAR